jgi:hypothetical protein
MLIKRRSFVALLTLLPFVRKVKAKAAPLTSTFECGNVMVWSVGDDVGFMHSLKPSCMYVTHVDYAKGIVTVSSKR